MAHCGVWSCKEGKGITSLCEHASSVSLTQCSSSERSQSHKICSGLQNKYCNCPLPPALVVSHSSLFLVPPHSLSSPLAEVRDPQDGTMSISGESQNDENNKVLGRGGDPQVACVPTTLWLLSCLHSSRLNSSTPQDSRRENRRPRRTFFPTAAWRGVVVRWGPFSQVTSKRMRGNSPRMV